MFYNRYKSSLFLLAQDIYFFQESKNRKTSKKKHEHDVNTDGRHLDF